MIHCDVVEQEEQMIAHYLGGLHVEISDVCNYNHIGLTMMFANYLMGTKVGLALKIFYKFQMGQLQDQESRRLRKQCKDWCNSLGMKLARA
jgi:hypothetical protein